MERWFSLAEVPQPCAPTTVTLGNFDGVHRGHVALLRELVSVAHDTGTQAVVVTFDPHPAAVHRPDHAVPAIVSLDERLDLIAATGVDATLVVPYTLEFAQQSPREFVQRYLVDLLNARWVVVGRDVRFGWRNAGDLDTLVALGAEFGFQVHGVDDQGEKDPVSGCARWSSTRVRDEVAAGRLDRAAEVLGRPVTLTGTVVHGEARGRTLGFPTANLGPDTVGLVPPDGVYPGWLVDAAGERFPAAVSVGTNPTFAGQRRQVEAYVLDRTDLDLYDQRVRVELVGRVRGQVAFESADQLVAQMHRDVAETKTMLGVG